VPGRFLHVSDLHFGRFEDPVSQDALATLVEELAPELVVATGDLTHRGRRDQHQRAAAFLRRLGPPLLAVPGNHDIPFAFPARFTRPWGEFERAWESTRPTYRSETLVVVGLNSVRPWRHQTGSLKDAELERATRAFDDAPPGALRVAALHHHLINAPWRTRKRPVARRGHVVTTLARAGVELILAGHTHQAAISERREFETPVDGAFVTLAVASGFGRPRPRRLGEARGVHVFEAQPDGIGAETYVWGGSAWERGVTRRLPRGR
jgi:3',5'-cyclic AMP phosphodiesterase CpdA